MQWFANLKIAGKIVVLIVLLGVVSVLAALFAANRMHGINRSYSAMVAGPARVAVDLSRSNRALVGIERDIFLLDTQTTDAGNQKALAAIRSDEKMFLDLTAKGKELMPDRAGVIDDFILRYKNLMGGVCGTVMQMGQSTDPEANAKALNLMADQCSPQMQGIISDMAAEVDRIIVANDQAAGGLSAEANWSIVLTLLVVGIGLASVIALAITLASKTIASPLADLTRAMRRFADNDLSADIPIRDRQDEIGQLARVAMVFRDNARAQRDLEERERRELEARDQRAKAVSALTADFDRTIGGVLQTVSHASVELESTASSMSASASQTDRQATSVAVATEQASQSVQTVATAAEELSASIREIAQQVQQSTTVSIQATEEATRTNEMVKGLADTASRIGEVVNLINDIAAQTNLLALNATIEAARAGDAGKGFAVVAGEVKNLANQTGRATEEISAQISAVQSATRDAVDAIAGIVQRIQDLSHISASVASAVEEQTAATQEIARNVNQAAQGTQHVSETIDGVRQAAEHTGAASEQVLTSARSLAHEADRMKEVVSSFLNGIRTA